MCTSADASSVTTNTFTAAPHIVLLLGLLSPFLALVFLLLLILLPLQ